MSNLYNSWLRDRRDETCTDPSTLIPDSFDFSGSIIKRSPDVLEYFDHGDVDGGGVVRSVLPYIIIPGVLFVLFIVFNSIACCCCCCAKGKTSYSKTKSLMTYILLVILTVALVVSSAFGATYSWKTRGSLECTMVSFIDDLVNGYQPTDDSVGFAGIGGIVEILEDAKDEISPAAIQTIQTEMAAELDDLLKPGTPETGYFPDLSASLGDIQKHIDEGLVFRVNRLQQSGALPAASANNIKASAANSNDLEKLVWVAEKNSKELTVFRYLIDEGLGKTVRQMREMITLRLDASTISSLQDIIDSAKDPLDSVADSMVDVYHDVEDAKVFKWIDGGSLGLAIFTACGLLAVLISFIVVITLTCRGMKAKKQRDDENDMSLGMLSLIGTGKGTCSTRTVCCIYIWIASLFLFLSIFFFPTSIALGSGCRILYPEDGNLVTSLEKLDILAGSSSSDSQSRLIVQECLSKNGKGDIIAVLDLEEDLGQFDKLKDTFTDLEKELGQGQDPFDDVLTGSEIITAFSQGARVITNGQGLALGANLIEMDATITVNGNSVTIQRYSAFCAAAGNAAATAFCTNNAQLASDLTAFVVAEDAYQTAQSGKLLLTGLDTPANDAKTAIDNMKNSVMGTPSRPSLLNRVNVVLLRKLNSIFDILDRVKALLNCKFIGRSYDTVLDGLCNDFVANLISTAICWLISGSLAALLAIFFIFLKKKFKEDSDRVRRIENADKHETEHGSPSGGKHYQHHAPAVMVPVNQHGVAPMVVHQPPLEYMQPQGVVY